MDVKMNAQHYTQRHRLVRKVIAVVVAVAAAAGQRRTIVHVVCARWCGQTTPVE